MVRAAYIVVKVSSISSGRIKFKADISIDQACLPTHLVLCPLLSILLKGNFLQTISIEQSTFLRFSFLLALSDYTNSDCNIHIERAWMRSNPAKTFLHKGFARFSEYLKIVFAILLKHSSFWPST